MRLGPAPTPPRAPASAGGGGDGGKRGPGRKGGGAGARGPPPPAPGAHWPHAPSVRGRGANAGGGAGRPRSVCLRNAESHVVLLFLVQSLGARCVTHCAAGTATSPGRRWQQQQHQPRRRRGPRVPGHTPAPRSAAQRRDRCGRARLKARPHGSGTPTLGPASESPGAAREPRRKRPRAAGPGGGHRPRWSSSGAPERGGRCATARCRPPRASPNLLHLLGPRDAGSGGRAGGGGSRSRPRPLRSPQPLQARPGGGA